MSPSDRAAARTAGTAGGRRGDQVGQLLAPLVIRRLHQQSTQVYQAATQAAGFELTSVQFAALAAGDQAGSAARS